MSMQSSPAVMLRALVMLACVVAIPLAAVFGKSMPEFFRTLFNGRWPTASAPPRASSDENSHFGPRLPTLPDVAAPTDNRALPWQQTPAWIGHTLDPSDPKVVQAAYESPLKASSGNAPIGPPDHRPGALPTGPSDPATQAPATGDPFARIQDRLRQFGATQYRLEFWGSRQQLYRFSCWMAVGGNPGYTRHFEATDSDHLRAMARVLQQVEAWRTGGG